MKRKFYFLVLAFFSTQAHAQEKITKYYNSGWVASSKADATYYIDFVKKDTLFTTTAYFIQSGKVQGRSTYADTTFAFPRGLLTRYNEQGILTDSGFYFNNGNTRYRYHYFDNGKLSGYYIGDEKGNEKEVKGFDEAGHEVKDYIFEREAAFPGGSSAWIRYISNNIKPNVPVKKGAPKGTYSVIVAFMVSKTGEVADAKAETDIGYGMEEEALRIVRKSPKWKQAMQYNRPVNAYRRQPITFVVQ